VPTRDELGKCDEERLARRRMEMTADERRQLTDGLPTTTLLSHVYFDDKSTNNAAVDLNSV